jgi:DNA-binding phage protein
VKTAKDSGVSEEEIAKNVAANTDVIVEMKSVVDQVDTTDAASSTNLFSNIGDAGKIVKTAKDSGVSEEEIAKNVAANTDVIAEMKSVVDQVDTTDAASSTNLFGNIGDAGNIVKKAKDAGLSTDDIAKSIAGNSDIITEMKSATDQLDELGAEGDASSFFTNISDVGRAVKKAKDLGVDDDELIKEMSRNPNQASKVNQAFEELGAEVDADGAKNLLGNVEQIDDTLTAIGHAKKSGADLKEFVKKDVEEHKALNNVVEKLGDSADKFLEEGIEDALQLNQAIEEGHVDADTLASSVSSGQSFSDAFKNSSVSKLNERFAGNDDFLEAVSLYEDQAKDILFALSFVDPGSSQELALMGNLDKLGAIMYLSHRFEDNPQRMNIIYSNLDVAIALDQLVAELGVFPGRLELVFQNADIAPSILATYQEYELTGAYDLIDQMFSSSQNLRNTISNDGLNKLLRDFPQFAIEIEQNRERAGEINNLITQVGQQYAPQIFENLEKFDDLHVMVLRTKGDPERIDTLFLHIEGLVEIRGISDHYKDTNVLGGQDVIFSNLELFAQDQAYYDLALESPKYFVRLSEIAGDLQAVPSALALQLKELDLNREELETVLNDLLAGPQVDGPTSSPPVQNGEDVSSDTATLSFLLDHVIPSQDDENVEGEVYLNPNKVVSYETASSSSFFTESADLYFMLSDLETTDDYQGTADTGSLQDAGYFVGGVFGGRNIEFNSATYNLSNLASENLLIAASGKLSLNGEIDIIAKSVEGSPAELIFMSLEQLTIQDGSSVKYHGDSLGFGSLESINVMNVDLFAEGEISLRSLDSLVINNSDMATSGNGGADFVHLLAASELAIDKLRFSEHVRQIAMEAMTINLSNLNFPAGSTVQLNSLYGGVDGKYPTFGGKEYGRVNFIQNVRYNQNLMNSRSTFDQFGGAISIGSIK